MSFRLSADSFDRLVEKERADGRLDSRCTELDAIWLHTDMGPVFYLTRDGRVLSEDVILETPIEEVPYGAASSALIMGAKHLDATELVSLLPERPADVPDCARCAGTGRWTLPGETAKHHGRVSRLRRNGLERPLTDR